MHGRSGGGGEERGEERGDAREEWGRRGVMHGRSGGGEG